MLGQFAYIDIAVCEYPCSSVDIFDQNKAQFNSISCTSWCYVDYTTRVTGYEQDSSSSRSLLHFRSSYNSQTSTVHSTW